MKGFFGDHTVQFSIMIALVRYLRPTLFVHACTKNFQYEILPELLNEYTLHHQFVRPGDHGIPARRTRSYAILVRRDYSLQFDIDELSRLTIPTNADCGVFGIAPQEEVHRIITSCVVRCLSFPFWVPNKRLGLIVVWIRFGLLSLS